MRDLSDPAFARLLGPVGSRAAAGTGPLRGFLPYAVLAALPVGFALARQQFCFTHGWGGKEPIFRQCYSDLVTSVQTAGLTAYLSGAVPLDQPPLAGTVMSAVAGVFGGGGLLTVQRLSLLAWALIAVGCLIAMTWAARTIVGHPDANPLMLALAPVTALTVLLSPDILGVTLATFGLWAWTRERPALAGLLLGLGVMARSYPLLLVVVVMLFAARLGRTRGIERLVYGAVGGMALGALPLITSPEVIVRAVQSWWRAPAGLGSLWYLPTLVQAPMSPVIASTLAVVGWLVAAVLAGVLILGSRRPPTLAAAALFAVAIVLITGKSFPVQASLWLVPLLALAGVRWRTAMLWSAAEAAHFVTVWLYVGGQGVSGRNLPGGWYLLFLMLRLLAVAFLAWQVWHEADAPLGEEASGTQASTRPTGRAD